MDVLDTPPPLKPPTTFQEQIQLLKSRNLTINSEESALKVLQRINYYRLSGYMLSFKENDVFKNGSTFEQIFQVYEFDRKLRDLLSGILELIEISARTSIAYHMSHTYGPLCYEDSNVFEDPSRHQAFIATVSKAIEDARKGHELFVEHHVAKYAGKIPIWSVVELMSFSTLSIFYSNLRAKDRKKRR
ncbi:Abi family protein [Cohnella pontilimi]|uniref:Abi family protein n=1 Tax=Cohnella pontilimi TaxID=2564100 RepID=UPI001B7FFEDC|nr:Abi family protein [Cohnella pontilimi]